MILTIIAIVLVVLILRQMGIFKVSSSTVKTVATAGILFVIIRGLVKILAPIFMIVFSAIMFDLIIWLGVNVFCDHGYTLATWRFFRSVFLGMAF
jgi:hypothetical protein